MERLTRRKTANIAGKEIALCNYKEDDCNDSCMYGRCKWQKHANMKLKEYEDLEEDGKLLKLPCKPGDTVYMIKDDCEFNGDCHQTRTCKSCEYRNVLIEEDIATLKFIVENIDKFGKTALLTEKEAMERIDRNYLKESQKREDEEQAAYLREWSRRHQKRGRTGNETKKSKTAEI